MPKLYFIFICLLILGCTDDLPIDDGDTPSAGINYYPNVEGSSWQYRTQLYLNNVPFGDAELSNTTFLGEEETEFGVFQKYLTGATISPDAGDEYYYIDDNDYNLVAIGGIASGGEEVVFVFPAWHYLEYPLQIGVSWQVCNTRRVSPTVIGLNADIDGDSIDDLINVEINCTVSTREDITTDAAYFRDCFRIKKAYFIEYNLSAGINENMEFTQTLWFCPDVGIVRIIGEDVAIPNGPRYELSTDLISYTIKEE